MNYKFKMIINFASQFNLSMSYMNVNSFIVFTFLLITTSSCGQHLKFLGDADSPPAIISELSWIEGSWHGVAFGGQTEEVWTAPSAGSMMGMFKLISEGEISFYELMTISEKEGSLHLRIKHFDKDMNGWEEKDKSVEFPLVDIKKNAVYFDGLTFKNISERQMNVYVNIEGEEVEFIYFRK